jgi:hypothetical protein
VRGMKMVPGEEMMSSGEVSMVDFVVW